jgi:hypothetical protein
MPPRPQLRPFGSFRFVPLTAAKSQRIHINPFCHCRSATDADGFRWWQSEAEDALDAVSRGRATAMADNLKANDHLAAVSVEAQMD